MTPKALAKKLGMTEDDFMDLRWSELMRILNERNLRMVFRKDTGLAFKPRRKKK